MSLILTSQKREICAGKNCRNNARHQLTIVYFNKKGWFCDFCREDLLNENLVTQDIMLGVENEIVKVQVEDDSS